MFLYEVAISAYFLLARLISFINPKAKKFIEGRMGWEAKLISEIKPIEKEKKIWIHCASLGEFEQGRPLIEQIKKNHSEYKIILSFFSPSGFEAKKKYELADIICYLPFDSKKNASKFLDIIQPKLIFFVKYEFWLNYLNEIKIKKIPCFLVSGIFRKNQLFFQWYGAPFKKALTCFQHFFVQDANSKNLLKKIGLTNTSITGDTRFDRVIEIANSNYEYTEIEKFSQNSFVIIGGSTWQKDEEYILKAYSNLLKKNNSIKLILAPHEINQKSISSLLNKIKETIHSVEVTKISAPELNTNAQVLIIDSIGILSKIYRYADFAIVGGGFTNGIHNILEPLVYKIPVAIGPIFKKYKEAIESINKGICYSFVNENELQKKIEIHLQNKINKTDFELKVQSYFDSNANATDKIISFLKAEKLLFTK